MAWVTSGLQYPASLLYTLCCHQSNDLLSIGHFILHNLSLRVITGQIQTGLLVQGLVLSAMVEDGQARNVPRIMYTCPRPDCKCRQQIMQREIARVVRVLAWLLASLIVIIQLTSVHRYHRQSPVLGLSMQSGVQLLAALANEFLWMGSIMQPLNHVTTSIAALSSVFSLLGSTTVLGRVMCNVSWCCPQQHLALQDSLQCYNVTRTRFLVVTPSILSVVNVILRHVTPRDTRDTRHTDAP